MVLYIYVDGVVGGNQEYDAKQSQSLTKKILTRQTPHARNECSCTRQESEIPIPHVDKKARAKTGKITSCAAPTRGHIFLLCWAEEANGVSVGKNGEHSKSNLPRSHCCDKNWDQGRVTFGVCGCGSRGDFWFSEFFLCESIFLEKLKFNGW